LHFWSPPHFLHSWRQKRLCGKNMWQNIIPRQQFFFNNNYNLNN
jgi:hypothetical protein